MSTRTLQSLVLNGLLLVLLFIVLMPLLWMMVTAFKQRGQGMNLQVIPSTEVVVELGPTPVPPDDPGERFAPVVFELPDPDRQWSSVTVAGEMNEWNAQASPMRWINGVWTRTFQDLAPGSYQYKFVADGDGWMGDPGNMTDGDPGANSVIEVGDTPTSNIALSEASRIEGDRLLIDLAAPGLSEPLAEVRQPGGEWVPIVLESDGDRWRGELDIADWDLSATHAIARRLRHTISFSEAWSRTYTIDNFRQILTDPDYPFGTFFLNSLVVATGCGLITVILCLLAGYAFAVKRFWGRDAIFWALFASMLIPGLVFVLPQFAIVNALGWRNSYQGMILPHVANVFGLFLMRQYIRTLPGDLFAAARVDGAGEWQVLRTIVIPLSMPIIVTLFLLTFMMQWSNFLWQLIVNSPDSPLRTLPVGLALFRGQHDVDWELMMSGACFSVVPIAILFIVAQRYFIEGLTAGAVKG
jgi:multiple sugar transport system permease protein